MTAPSRRSGHVQSLSTLAVIGETRAYDFGGRVTGHDRVTPDFVFESVPDLNSTGTSIGERVSCCGKGDRRIDRFGAKLDVLHFSACRKIGKQLHQLIGGPFGLKYFGERFVHNDPVGGVILLAYQARALKESRFRVRGRRIGTCHSPYTDLLVRSVFLR